MKTGLVIIDFQTGFCKNPFNKATAKKTAVFTASNPDISPILVHFDGFGAQYPRGHYAPKHIIYKNDDDIMETQEARKHFTRRVMGKKSYSHLGFAGCNLSYCYASSILSSRRYFPQDLELYAVIDLASSDLDRDRPDNPEAEMKKDRRSIKDIHDSGVKLILSHDFARIARGEKDVPLLTPRKAFREYVENSRRAYDALSCGQTG